jgi:hypothetical protein
MGRSFVDWPSRLVSEFQTADQRARHLVEPLTPKQLNWKPSADVWSIGQCLQHLVAANEVYLPAIETSLENKQPLRVDEIVPGWFGRWFIRTYIEPSSEIRHARAPKKIEPQTQVEPSVLDAFLRSNQAVRELVLEAGDYDINRIRFKNPFVPLLRFTVGTGLEILSKHQSRHLLQAERVAQHPSFPKE